MTHLNYISVGNGSETVVILHGLFGSLDNWKTPAKFIGETKEVILVDQRNHGRSFWSDDFNYDLLAEDLKKLVDELGIRNFSLIGHSMGGKTAMRFAQLYPEYINKLVIVDMGIKIYPMHHDTILEGLKALDLNEIKSRGEAEEKLSQYIPDLGVRQFLLKNLYWIDKEKLGWRINIPVLEEKMPEILKAIPDSPKVESDSLFIYGGQSNYIVESDQENIIRVFTHAKFLEIKESGHWIHAEAPEAFLKAVNDFL